MTNTQSTLHVVIACVLSFLSVLTQNVLSTKQDFVIAVSHAIM